MLENAGHSTPMPVGINRRGLLHLGLLGLGGLGLADLLRQESRGEGQARSAKSVIMVYLPGGPSHIDMYDMKPDAPAEIRGEFKRIKTNVAGIDLCELMPLQATIADRFALIRGFKTPGGHNSTMLTTGFREGVYRPAFGSVVSRLSSRAASGLPPYVTLIEESNLPFGQDAAYLGPAHKPLSLRGPGMANLTLPKGISVERLHGRVELLRSFDAVRRDLDVRRDQGGLDAFTARALDMVASPKAREAFDLTREPDRVREKYGKLAGSQAFLLARRLVEAGVRVVTVAGGWDNNGEGNASGNLSNWDTHENNFIRLRKQLPPLDRALYALLTDLRERGREEDVAVVVCGEMGRAPRVGKANDGGNASGTGRDHWATGFAFVAGGGFRTGQVIGETDRHGAQPRTRAYGPQNLLATLYQTLGIDAATTFPDHLGRPQYLLDDREPISELL
jgi:hypothetical protein